MQNVLPLSLAALVSVAIMVIGCFYIAAPERVYDEFVEKSVDRGKCRTVGDPLQSLTEQGLQVDGSQFKRVMSYIESGKQAGAELLTGGNRVGDRGFFVQPTVFGERKKTK